MPRNQDPIRKITTMAGEIKYRFVIDMGKRPDGGRDQRCFTFTKYQEARAERAKIIAARQSKTLIKPAKATFDELAQQWLDSRHDVREVTRLGYEYVLKSVRTELGHLKVQDLSRTHIERLIKTLRQRGLSHRSIVYALGTIKQVLAYGVSTSLLATNVAASVKAPRRAHSDSKPKAVWDPQELLRFRAVADQDDWAAAWRLTLCGLRRSEVLGLKWDAVDLVNGEVVVQAGRVLLDGHRTATDDPKSSASRRTVPVEDIQPGTIALLRALKARQAADKLRVGVAYIESGYVLVNLIGEPVRPEAYSDRFAVLCRHAEVPEVGLHDVRHTLATIMHRAGLAPSDAAALLGHTVAVHLATYVTPTQKGARAAASGLGAAISEAM
jgi:integrase